MTKKLIPLLLFAFSLSICSCSKQERRNNPHILYEGHRWDVIRLNDSIVVCVPGLNANSKCTPVVIYTSHPDSGGRAKINTFHSK